MHPEQCPEGQRPLYQPQLWAEKGRGETEEGGGEEGVVGMFPNTPGSVSFNPHRSSEGHGQLPDAEVQQCPEGRLLASGRVGIHPRSPWALHHRPCM